MESCQSGTTLGPSVRASTLRKLHEPLRKILIGGAIAGTAVLGGAVGASLLGTAGAQTTTTTPRPRPAHRPPSCPRPGRPAQGHRTPEWSKGGHQANGKTETVLTGDDTTKANAAAEAAVPGATPSGPRPTPKARPTRST